VCWYSYTSVMFVVRWMLVTLCVYTVLMVLKAVTVTSVKMVSFG